MDFFYTKPSKVAISDQWLTRTQFNWLEWKTSFLLTDKCKLVFILHGWLNYVLFFIILWMIIYSIFCFTFHSFFYFCMFHHSFWFCLIACLEFSTLLWYIVIAVTLKWWPNTQPEVTCGHKECWERKYSCLMIKKVIC